MSEPRHPALALMSILVGGGLLALAWRGPLDNLTGGGDSPAWAYLAIGAVPGLPGLALVLFGAWHFMRTDHAWQVVMAALLATFVLGAGALLVGLGSAGAVLGAAVFAILYALFGAVRLHRQQGL